MKPIPRRLLIHSAVWKSAPNPDGWGGQTATDVSVQAVRIEPSSALARAKDNEKVTLSAVLFYDCTNSAPTGIDWTGAENSKVQALGRTYTVVQATPLYDGKRLHHWEMGLL